MRQLPAELQLQILSHDHEIGLGGRHPSQHLVSLVGMAWAGTLHPPALAAPPAQAAGFEEPLLPPTWPEPPLPPPPPPLDPDATAPPLPALPEGLGLEPLKREVEVKSEPSSKKRKMDEEPDEASGIDASLAVEGFLRLNGIDAKSCRAMRRLPAEAQKKLIKMDLRRRRNPSAFLWAQIQKLRDTPDGPAPRPPPVPPPVPVKQERVKSDLPVFVLVRHTSSFSNSVPPLVEIGASTAKEPLTAGRAPQSDILLKAQHVSKRHAEFSLQVTPRGEPSLLVCDLSSNGTWLNGKKLKPHQPTLLQLNDVVAFLPGEHAPALQVLDPQAPPLELPGIMAKPVEALTAGGSAELSEVSEWIRSVGGGGKLSGRLIEEIEDSYDHLAQIAENYRGAMHEFLEIHAVEDCDEQELLLEALAALCSWQTRTGR